jgi:hypothetical protein
MARVTGSGGSGSPLHTLVNPHASHTLVGVRWGGQDGVNPEQGLTAADCCSAFDVKPCARGYRGRMGRRG